MKKSLSAVFLILVSLIFTKSVTSKIEMKISKATIKTEDGSQPGDNGRVQNGGKKSSGIPT